MKHRLQPRPRARTASLLATRSHMELNGKLYEAPLDTLRRQLSDDRAAFMTALKAAGMTTVGERLAFEQKLRASQTAPGPSTLPETFIESAFPTKRDYEASLQLKPSDRLFAENAARCRANAGMVIDGIETPIHGPIHAGAGKSKESLSTFGYFLAGIGGTVSTEAPAGDEATK